MNILVTGGAGYIGTALLEQLKLRSDVDRVTIYDNLSRHNFNAFIGISKLDRRFTFVEGDILDSRKLRQVVREADVVVHLAAKVTTPFADQQAHLFEQVNHWGTAELCYAIEAAPRVRKVVYASSVSVYGAGDDPKDTQSQLNPRTFYGISKMRGEEHVGRLSSSRAVSILRCANVYGYNRSVRFDAVINKFMLEANFHRKINIHGSGAQERPFVFIDTVAQHLEGAIVSDGDGIQNLVEDNFSISDIARVIGEIYPELEVIFINHNMPMRALHVAENPSMMNGEPLLRLRERLEDFKGRFSF